MMFALNFAAVCFGLKFPLSHFVLARSLRSALIKGGGWVKISDFAIVKGEQVKFKILAFLLSGGENPWLRRR